MPRVKMDDMGDGYTAPIRSVREGQTFVYYEKSVTKNMGNYESAKITIGVTLPLEPTTAEVGSIKKTLEIGDEIVTEELKIQLKELV